MKIYILIINWGAPYPAEYHTHATRDGALNHLVHEMLLAGVISEMDLDLSTLSQLTQKHQVKWDIIESQVEEVYHPPKQDKK